MEPKAVLFDLDGVLADTIESHYLTWKEVAARLEVPFSPEISRKLHGLSRRNVLEALLGGRQLPEDQVSDLLDLKNELFVDYIKEMGPKDLLPGALELLRQLRAAGIASGVSSSSANVHVIVAKLGIGEFIQAIGDRYRVANLKPAPDVFLYTAAALGRSPQECVVIEDSEAGVAAGHAAGMCVIGIGRPGLLPSADAVFPDLRAVTLEDLAEVYTRWRDPAGAESQGIQPQRSLGNELPLEG